MGLIKYVKEREKARLAEKAKRIKKAQFEGEKLTVHDKINKRI